MKKTCFNRIFITILFFASSISVYSQEIDTVQTDNTVETMIENVSESLDAEVDFTEYVEEFQYYLQNPMNLNSPDYEVLKRVFGLSDFQVYQLKAYISVSGELVSLYELNSIKGFDKQTIFKLLPYVTIQSTNNPYKINLKNVFKYGRNQLFLRYQQVLEEQTGYSFASDSLLQVKPNSRYLGSPQKYYVKYAFNYQNKIRFGITGEKDAGEEFFKGTQKNGFDFYSAHLFFKDFGVVKALAIGDYHLQFGQGLTLWTGLGYGKSSSVTSIKKRAQGIRPYTSADENNFMRGIATTLRLKNWELSLFYSKNQLDANIDSLDSEEYYITTLQETGFHRTPSELNGKNTTWEQLFGGHLTFKTEFSKFGLTFSESNFERSYLKDLSFYNKYDFVGQKNQNFGFDYETYVKKIGFYGEASLSMNGGWGMVNGMDIQLDPLVSFSVLHRYYARDFQNLHSIAFGENSRNANEQGLYLGLNVILHSKLTIDSYIDLFSFEWLRYRVDAPSNGGEYFVQLNYTPSRYTSIYVRYKEKIKSINSSNDTYLNRVYNEEKQNFRIHFSHRLLKNLTVKNRVEWSSYQTASLSTKMGFMMYQDASYNFSKIPLNISARYAIFNTDTYDERIYAYESDVLYAFSIPAYYYKGTRAYVVLKYSVMKNLDLWFRIAQTWYADRDIISSGLEEINGNTKTDIKVQLRLKF